MRAVLLALVIAVLAVSVIAAQSLGFHVNSTARVGTSSNPASFSNIIIVAMENQNYGAVIGSSSAPFINSMAQAGTVLSNYQAYSQNINGCSHGCYEAFTAGNQLLSDGGCPRASSPCSGAPQPDVTKQLQTAGLSSALFCEDGCPRGSDHFPFIEYADTWQSCMANGGGMNCAGTAGPDGAIAYNSNSASGNTEFINYLNSANPASYIWFTPTDSHNMHDNSVSSGDSYIDTLLTGSGTLSSPASNSVFGSSIWKAGHTLLYLWWDENSNPPMVLYGPMVKVGFTASETLNEYYMLHMIENNWGMPTITSVVSGDTAPTDLFTTVTGPTPLSASFTVTPAILNPTVTATFTASVSGGTPPYSYNWNFGDSSSNSTATVATHAYAQAGAYSAKLIVKDTSGPVQSVTSSNTVTVVNAPPPGTAPLVSGFAAGLAEVSTWSSGNPSCKSGVACQGGSASDFEYNVQVMQKYGFNGVRADFDSLCTNTGSFPQGFSLANYALAVQIASYYHFWIVVDWHSYNDIFNSQSCWLSQWNTIVTAPASTYSQIIWEPENEPAYGQSTTCSGSAACLPILSSTYQSWVNQARTSGDGHWIVIQNICSYGCGITGTGAGDQSGALNGFPSVTDSTNRLFYSIHGYLQTTNAACGSSPWSVVYAQCDAQGFYNMISTWKASGHAVLNTESGADEFTNLGGCGYSGAGQPASSIVLCGSAGYSTFTLAFIQQLYTLYQANSIGSLYWTAGDWTGTPGAGAIGGLQSVAAPATNGGNAQGFGCVMVGTTLCPATVVVPPFSVAFNFMPSTPTVGQTVTFTATGNGGTTPYSFTWSFGDAGTASGSPVTYIYLTAATFTVGLTGKDSTNPQNTATSTLSVFTVCTTGIPPNCTPPPPPLTTGFTVTPPSPLTGQTVTFVANATGGVPLTTCPPPGPCVLYNFAWNFGDGNSATGKTVTHTYGSAGSYPVMLTTTDGASPPDSATATFNGTPAPCPGGLSIIVTSCGGSSFPTWIFVPIGVGVGIIAAVLIVKRRH